MKAKRLAELARVSVWQLSEIENDRLKPRGNRQNCPPYCSDRLAWRLAAALDCDIADFTAPGPRDTCPACTVTNQCAA